VAQEVKAAKIIGLAKGVLPFAILVFDGEEFGSDDFTTVLRL
jgi:hypothetical protein